MSTNPYQPPGTEKSLEDRPSGRHFGLVLFFVFSILATVLLTISYLLS